MKLNQLREDFDTMKKTWEEIFNANFGSDTEKIIRLSRKMRNKENSALFLNNFIKEFYNVEVTLDIRNTSLGSYHETWGSIFVTYVNFLETDKIVSELNEDDVKSIIKNTDTESCINELILDVNGENDILSLDTMKYQINVK